MAEKLKTVFICTECGYESPKWLGRCPGCNSWNTMSEETARVEPKTKTAKREPVVGTPGAVLPVTEVQLPNEPRWETNISEFDRVLGGGLVKGSVVLVGGEPGIGKSTLMLQVCERIAQQAKVLYISGEESAGQLKLRAERLSIRSARLFLFTGTDLEDIIATIETERPGVVVVDSIQTVNCPNVTSIPGSVTQIKEATMRFAQLAKEKGISLFLIGHVNKEGAIAGPKVLEHIVDAVLYFEGDRDFTYRLLRAAKNRYGSTSEIGMFAMSGDGLEEVQNPSQMLLSGKPANMSGICAAATAEGSRAIIAEVQALVAPANYGSARRVVSGADYNRIAMLLAVLEKRAGLRLSSLDVYINVVGGFRLSDNSSDLALALAIASSYKDSPVGDSVAVFGELGLAGELRSVRGVEARVAEAARLGFQTIVLPYQSRPKKAPEGVDIIAVRTIVEAVARLL